MKDFHDDAHMEREMTAITDRMIRDEQDARWSDERPAVLPMTDAEREQLRTRGWCR